MEYNNIVMHDYCVLVRLNNVCIYLLISIKIIIITQISFASGLAALSDRTQFLRYFRNSPTFAIVSPGLCATMVHFHRKRIAILSQDEFLFKGV